MLVQRFAAWLNSFSALQRAEIAEIAASLAIEVFAYLRFSALQRAEIAEIPLVGQLQRAVADVSVLFNEPKLLKY